MLSNAGAYHFQGTLLPVDSTSYLTLPFDVPPTCRRIRLTFDYAPHKAGDLSNLITLGLYDAHGFRGEAHRNPDGLAATVSAAVATPGFIAGPLPAGHWIAELAVHCIVPSSEPCAYTLDIDVSGHAPSATPATEADVSAAGAGHGAGWYRGELHAHTVHSDGECTVAQVIAHAQARKLDFIAISDHNTISPWAEIAALPAGGPLVIPSLELTTFFGHAVALGVERWVDWRTGREGWTINDAARAVHDAGGLFIIAHPAAPGSPYCTGCRWDYTDMDMTLIDGMEVWSGAWNDAENNNPRNLSLWREQVAAQRTVSAVAAADFHSPHNWHTGVPVTYVYTEEFSQQGIMAAIRAGRVMLTTGPWLELRQTSVRGTLSDEHLRGTPLRTNLLALWKDAPPGARLRQMSGVTQLSEIAVGAQGRQGLLAASGRVHLELWSADNMLLAITNPIGVT